MRVADIHTAPTDTYCVFHLEPAPAMTVLIFVITRLFLVFGVFVGLFMGVRRYDFFLGGHFGEIGPFYAHFSPEASKRDFLGSEFCFWPRGRQATALRPAWGSALQPGGRESRARPLCAWGSFARTFECCTECRSTPMLTTYMRRMVTWCC